MARLSSRLLIKRKCKMVCKRLQKQSPLYERPRIMAPMAPMAKTLAWRSMIWTLYQQATIAAYEVVAAGRLKARTADNISRSAVLLSRNRFSIVLRVQPMWPGVG